MRACGDRRNAGLASTQRFICPERCFGQRPRHATKHTAPVVAQPPSRAFQQTFIFLPGKNAQRRPLGRLAVQARRSGFTPTARARRFAWSLTKPQSGNAGYGLCKKSDSKRNKHHQCYGDVVLQVCLVHKALLPDWLRDLKTSPLGVAAPSKVVTNNQYGRCKAQYPPRNSHSQANSLFLLRFKSSRRNSASRRQAEGMNLCLAGGSGAVSRSG